MFQKAFKGKKLQLLVSTDVSAREIDIEGLSFILHQNLPEQIEYYTHRSGRTARAGKKGLSLSFITEQDKKQIKRMESALNISFSETIV